MVIKTIIYVCLVKFNLNPANPHNYQHPEKIVQQCTDAVSACYYTKTKDIFKCLKNIETN